MRLVIEWNQILWLRLNDTSLCIFSSSSFQLNTETIDRRTSASKCPTLDGIRPRIRRAEEP